jgi:hypothetical protein
MSSSSRSRSSSASKSSERSGPVFRKPSARTLVPPEELEKLRATAKKVNAPVPSARHVLLKKNLPFLPLEEESAIGKIAKIIADLASAKNTTQEEAREIIAKANREAATIKATNYTEIRALQDLKDAIEKSKELISFEEEIEEEEIEEEEIEEEEIEEEEIEEEEQLSVAEKVRLAKEAKAKKETKTEPIKELSIAEKVRLTKEAKKEVPKKETKTEPIKELSVADKVRLAKEAKAKTEAKKEPVKELSVAEKVRLAKEAKAKELSVAEKVRLAKEAKKEVPKEETKTVPRKGKVVPKKEVPRKEVPKKEGFTVFSEEDFGAIQDIDALTSQYI